MIDPRWPHIPDDTPAREAAGILFSAWRKASGVAAVTIATACGVSIMSVSRWSRGIVPQETRLTRQGLESLLPPDIFDALAADWWGR